MAIDKKPIQDLPVKHFGDKHFSSEFNTVRNSLLDIIDGINAVPAMIESDFKGIISPSDPAPTEDGTYKPSVSSADPGTNYPNAGNLKSRDGYSTLFYKKGSIWTKSESVLQGVAVAPEFDPNNDTDAQAGKQIAEYVNFKSKPFNYVLDFSKDNFGKYTELVGPVTFSEGSGSVFGKVAYVKLTGGAVIFPSDFVPQLGTADYDPTKTNTIAFWKEYDKIRFFNETSALEPVPTNDIITYYNFQNRTPNAALSTIPHIGAVFTGNISDHSISTTGQYLRRLTTATSAAAAIAVNTGTATNYKASFLMSIFSNLDILIGGNTYDNYVNYINIRAKSPSSDVVWVSSSNPTGTTIATTPNIPYPQVDWYVWEFVVNGSQVKFYCNGNFIVEYTNPNTGSFFSFILNRVEDGLKSFKIEKL